MKSFTRSALLAALALCHPTEMAWAGDTAYLEFLWAAPGKGALARAEAFGFTLEADQDHRVCVVALTDTQPNGHLAIEILDASGTLVTRQEYDDFGGAKRCYKAALGTTGEAGHWTFKAYIDGALAGTKTIEVARTLESAPFHSQGSHPYVLGRPNYDPTIPADEYNGRLVWIMHVDPAGSVSRVEIETAEGAGSRMRARAMAAGLLTRFPPDEARSVRPLKVRQEYNLSSP